MAFVCGFVVTVYARFSIESLASVPRKVITLFLRRKLEHRRHRRRSLCVGVPCSSANPCPGSAASSLVKDRLALPRPENAEQLVTIEGVKPNARHACGILYLRSNIQFEKNR